MLPGELEVREELGKRFDPLARKLRTVTTCTLGVCVAYHAGIDNLRRELIVATAGNLVERRSLPPNFDAAICD